MKYKLIFALLAVFLILPGQSVSGKGKKPLQYDIEKAGIGVEGTILVKVWVYTKNGKGVSDQDLKRVAVHGIVFRGCSGGQSGARQPAMAPATAEADNAAFCEAFFADDGPCQNYATIVAGSYDRVKTQKGYKSGAVLQIDKTSLRKELEKAGVVRVLSSGF
ncbi:hypothetical protein [Leyella stercorea]|uniref:hypothetical protein n=1 Tax=Leyella stercorea TaxID=363265 RepID=UPI00242D9909|nr:hypothetical protein [Leyella stercorea]